MSAAIAIAFTILAVALFVRRLIRWHFDARNNPPNNLTNRKPIPFDGLIDIPGVGVCRDRSRAAVLTITNEGE